MGPVASQYVEAFALLDNFRDLNGELQLSDIVLYASLIQEHEVLEFVRIMVSVNRSFIQAVKDKKATQELIDGMVAASNVN